MKAQAPAIGKSPGSAFPYINGINMEVAIELLGQEIAKCATAIDDEEKAGNNHSRIESLREQMLALRQRQQALRADQPKRIHAVFAEFGAGRKDRAPERFQRCVWTSVAGAQHVSGRNLASACSRTASWSASESSG